MSFEFATVTQFSSFFPFFFQVEGLPDGAKPNLTLQLSSPIEEGTLDKIYDPLSPSAGDTSPQGSIVVFRGVEPSMATLTVAAKDADIPLGSSTPHEVALLCKMDPMDIKDKYTTELPVAIVADDDTSGAAVAEASVDDTAAQSSSEQSGEATAAATVTAIQPTCTVTLRITYKPSPKDQREELYELLNKTSQRKATALENLRKLSMQQSANKSAGPAASGGTVVPKPSVKPGFLNKSKAEESGSKWKKFYDRALGPESMARRGAMLGFALKDFFIFFGAVTFFHFKGQLLAIPPPV